MQDVRRKVLKGAGALGGAIAAPGFYVLNAWTADFRNNPAFAKAVTLGFNVPQGGPNAGEVADELKAFAPTVPRR